MLECAQEVYFINLIEWVVIEVCYFKFIILFVLLMGLNITNNLYLYFRKMCTFIVERFWFSFSDALL